MNEIANSLLLEKTKVDFILTRKKRQNQPFLENKGQQDTPPHYNLYKKCNKHAYPGAAIIQIL